MPRPPSITPTDGELEILQIVWRLKRPSTRDVFDVVAASRPIDQATITTIMATMERKGQLRVVDERRPRRYEAVSGKTKTYRAMLKHLADRIGGGSIRQLLEQTLGRHTLTAQEEAQIEKEFMESE